MDEMEREKLFQEIRARISDSELEARRLREEELAAETARKNEMHWGAKVGIFAAILLVSVILYFVFSKLGLIW